MRSFLPPRKVEQDLAQFALMPNNYQGQDTGKYIVLLYGTVQTGSGASI
jgi:hypothetical protein